MTLYFVSIQGADGESGPQGKQGGRGLKVRFV